MSDCDKVEKWLVDYLDGNLAPARHEWVESHLAICPECHDAARAYRSIREAYRDLPVNDVSSDVAESILSISRMEADPGRPKRLSWRRPAFWPVAAAAAVLLIFGLIRLFDTGEQAVSLVREADALCEGGNHLQAIAKYREALQIDPDGPEAASIHHKLGSLYLQTNEYEKALENLLVVLQGYPAYEGREQAMLQKGDALASLGRFEEAMALYRRFSEEYPTGRLSVERRIGDLKSARELRTRLRSLGYLGR